MTSPPEPKPSAPIRRRWRIVALVAVVLAVILSIGGIVAQRWLASESALGFLAAEMTARSGGRIVVEGAEGSLVSTLRLKRLTYRDATLTIVADDVALDWSPSALWSKALAVNRLDARRVTVTPAPSTEPSRLPASLALPFTVTIERASVGELVFDGASRQRIERIAFGYAGDANGHRISALQLTVDGVAIDADATIAATPPFAVGGRLRAAGGADWRNATIGADLSGRLDAIDARLAGALGAATLHGNGRLLPFDVTTLTEAKLDVAEVDLAQLDAALPPTRIAGQVNVRLATDGRVDGTIDAVNHLAGAFDDARLPVAAARTRFTVADATLALEDLDARPGPTGGRVTGGARIPLAGTADAAEFALAVAGLDLKRLHGALQQTALSGPLRIRVDRSGQRFEGTLAQAGVALEFAATHAGDVVDVPRFHARSPGGELVGKGRFRTAAPRAFEAAATLRRFDPSRFGDLPAAALDGEVNVAGRLDPAWQADVSATIAPSSTLAGAPLRGEVRGRVRSGSVDDAKVDLAFAGATLKATGSAGRQPGRIDFAFDIPDAAATLAPLGARVPAALRPLAGRLRGKGTLSGALDDPAIVAEVQAQAAALSGVTLRTLELRGEMGSRASDRKMSWRAIALDVTTPAGKFTSIAATLDGTISRHTLTVATKGEDLDADLRLEGGLAGGRWTGQVVRMENRGAYAAALVAPATLDVAAGAIAVGTARFKFADGDVRVAGFRWDDGRITSEGALDGLPVASVAKMAGAKLPFNSTLVVGGDWRVVASPGLNGTLTLRRQRGDLFTRDDTDPAAAGLALGLSRLDVTAKLVDDALEASVDVDGQRLGKLAGTFTIGRDPGVASGRIGPQAPVRGKLTASLPSLSPWQPLIGTAAQVEGRVQADLTASGNLSELRISGELNADALKLDAPQYGLHWHDGRLRARLADGALQLDEFSYAAGDGRFHADGIVARAGKGSGDGAGTRIKWRADRLQATNRPDLKLVLTGSGQLSYADQQLLLSGAVKVDEGVVDFESRQGGRLGDDVVVKGRPRRTDPTAGTNAIPVGLELAVDLGPSLAASGEGLKARAAGKIDVRAAPGAAINAKGTIRAVNGTFFAFGQRLTIDRGRLIFDGPITNPALDIVALRKNLAVEAGVRVSGTVKVPHIDLTSEPPVPDGEKLSWLVLGQGLDRTSAADAAALQAAAATLFGGGRVPLGTTLAQSVGLDDISVRSSSSAAGDSGSGTGNQVVAVGKRLSDRLYVVYEQGLSVANNALKIEYALTRSITLRAEAGLISGVGIYYRRSFR